MINIAKISNEEGDWLYKTNIKRNKWFEIINKIMRIY
jgi:hypothetical protein